MEFFLNNVLSATVQAQQHMLEATANAAAQAQWKAEQDLARERAMWQV
jgi:hypothetical protein